VAVTSVKSDKAELHRLTADAQPDQASLMACYNWLGKQENSINFNKIAIKIIQAHITKQNVMIANEIRGVIKMRF
jgi:hypothetical protein